LLYGGLLRFHRGSIRRNPRMAKERLHLVEVSPRDGLQNEPEILDAATKLAMIDRAVAAGFTRMEAGSFVNPAKVPQMADSPVVFEALCGREGAVFIALALNVRGLERAIEAGAREVNYVFCCSDGFSIRNNGAAVAETLKVWPEAIAKAKAAGVRLSATLSTAFGCPFDGEVPVSQVAAVVETVAAGGPFEIALADTIGVASPKDVKERFAAAMAIAPGVQWRAHFHNTRNTALANAVAAVEQGVRVLDGSLAGIGGCPFAPGAAGNVPSEDLVYMFERMGFDTGVDLERAIETARFIGGALGKATPGMVSRAGGFPHR
jgi:hydroxymethylglutaryl-CoA lyase